MNETSVQLGLLDGAIRLNSANRESLDLAVNLTRERYLEYACAIDPQADDGDTVYWRIVFALVSVHSPIGATFKAYKPLRLWSIRFGRKPRFHQTIERILRASNADDGAIMYAPTKAWYIADFTRAWESDSAPFTRQGATDHDWRLRLVRNVRGLGIAKASFAVALCNPLTATVCCIDTHMYQTSEQNEWRDERHQLRRTARLFTIREAIEDADGFRINTVGEFQAYGTLAQAKAGIRQLLREQDIPVNCATAR